MFTAGELKKGIAGADNPARERTRVESFLQHIPILLPDEATATATAYGRIAGDLDSRGQRIPENDLWIAAVAIECAMTLATADAHFSRIGGLSVMHWSW